MESPVHPITNKCRQPRIEPCSHTCTHKPADFKMLEGRENNMDLPSRSGRCPRGFSTLQIAILSVLKTRWQIITYWQIAELVMTNYKITTTEGAVRGALERIYRRGFLIRNRAAIGSLRGNRYAFTADPCDHIKPYTELTQPDLESAARRGMLSVEPAPPSILEKKDRKNLSVSSQWEENKNQLEALTEENIKFHWPKLAGFGFGTHQIRQIIERLEQKNLPLSNVSQGLEHAEWELKHGQMKDAEGFEIKQPVNWVFRILARQGYYPRPSGYISPQEQVERDATEERRRLIVAREERLKMEYDSWLAGLSPDEKLAIVRGKNNGFGMPDKAVLQNYFRAEIWPKLRKEGAE